MKILSLCGLAIWLAALKPPKPPTAPVDALAELPARDFDVELLELRNGILMANSLEDDDDELAGADDASAVGLDFFLSPSLNHVRIMTDMIFSFQQ